MVDSPPSDRFRPAATSDNEGLILVRRTGAPSLSAKRLGEEIERVLPERTVRVAGTPTAECDLLPDATIVVGNSISRDYLDRAEQLRLYAHTSSGTDALPLDELERQGIAVTNAAGLMPWIAEQVVGYLLTFARDLREGYRRQQRKEWRHYRPGTLTGSTVTVVGCGAIGTQILERLEPFAVERIGVRHTPEKGGPADLVVGYDELHRALDGSDYLVLSCPLTGLTRGLVGEDELVTLPNDAVVVNVARGPVLRTKALVTALRRNVISGAALDVTDPEPLPADHPLWSLENVVLTPHNAGSSSNLWDRVAELLAENLERVAATGTYADLRNQVIAP
jgi:phosphoglycerate dehydrogenase-like enzyme